MFWENFIELCAKHNTKPNPVATALGISSGAVTKWKQKNATPSDVTLKKIADYFDVSVERLLYGEGNYTKDVIQYHSSNLIKLPVYGFVAAGEGMFAESNIVDYETADLEDTTTDREYFYLKIHGDSMYPVFIEGDYILVQHQTSVDSGEFAVALIDDNEGVVKRVVYGDNWIQLQSINPMYPPRCFDGPEVQRIKIIGLVKSLKRKF